MKDRRDKMKSVSFEEMEVWQHARDLVREVYIVSGQGNFARDFGLCDQIRRAAVSVMSNIAEGSERFSVKEFIQYLFIAKASAAEVRSQLYVAIDLNYLDQQKFDTLYPKLLSISRQLSGFIKYLQQKI